MPFAHAVLRIDHQHAEIVEFDREHAARHNFGPHSHYTRQHHSDVRAEHEFFGKVCDALGAYPLVVVTGPHTGLAAFRHYVKKHRPHLEEQLTGWEVVDHPSEGQLVTFARQYLSLHARMAPPAA